MEANGNGNPVDVSASTTRTFLCLLNITGHSKMVLDLSLRPEIKFIRARWELNRWGRGTPLPMFVAGLELTEVPPMSRETPGKSAAMANR